MKGRAIEPARVDWTGRLHSHPASWIGGPLHRTPSDAGDRIRVACVERHCAPISPAGGPA